MENISPDILQFLTNFGAAGVLALWLRWALNRVTKLEDLLDRREAEIKEVLRDCNRREDDTRRVPQIPEAEKVAYRARMNEPP